MASKFAQDLVAGTPARKGPRPPVDATSGAQATPEQVNAAWLPHLGRLIQQSTDPFTGVPGPPDVEKTLGLHEEEQQQLSELAGGDKEVLADLQQKLFARDAVSFGGMFFGGPTIQGGAGVLGAAAGAAGRLAGGASIGAGLGLTEGLLGGYDPEDLPRLAGEYAAGAALIGIPIEGIIGGVTIARNLKFRNALKALAKQVDGKIRTTGEIHEAIAKDPAVGQMFQDIEKANNTITGGREELKLISKEARGRGRTVTSSDIKDSPGLRDFLFNSLKEKHPDLSPNADPAVLWNLAKDEGILPSAIRRESIKPTTDAKGRPILHPAVQVEGRTYAGAGSHGELWNTAIPEEIRLRHENPGIRGSKESDVISGFYDPADSRFLNEGDVSGAGRAHSEHLVRGRRVVPRVEGEAAKSARDAYNAALGAPDIAGTFYSRGKRRGALEAARTAAYHAKNEELANLLKVGSLRGAAMDNELNANLAKGHRYIYNTMIKRVADLVKSPQFFGQAGPAFGKMLHEFTVLREGVEGHWTRIVQDHILHGLNKADLENLDNYLRWGAPADNTRVLRAARHWMALRKIIADDANSLKIQAKDRGLSELFRGLKPADKAAILKAQRLKAAAEGAEGTGAEFMALAEVENALSPEAAALWKDIGRLKGVVEEARGFHVIRPFQESAIKAPDYYRPELLDAMAKDPEHPIIQSLYRLLLDERPELKHPATGQPYHNAVMAEVRERLGIGGQGAPEYIWNNGLQWSRESIIDPKYRINDPSIWMTRYAHAAASRLSAARVFGPKEERFEELFKFVARETADRLSGGKFKAAGYGTQEGGQFKLSPNLQMLNDIYNMAMGRGEVTPKWMRQAMDATLRQRIGYTTFIKQFSSLKNVAAAHGFGNTLDAMYQVLRDPKMRQLGDDVGATLADLVRVLADDTLAMNPENPLAQKAVSLIWGKSAADQMRRTGTLLGDRFTRRVSAVAAGLKVSQAARDVRLLGSSNRGLRMRGEQARRWLESMDLDVDQIIQNGLTDGQRRQAMLSGARSTQFTSQVEDLPILATTSPNGRAIALLNKFSYQQGPFIIKHLLTEGVKGNLKPIIAFAVFAGMSDRAMAELLKMMSSSKYDIATDMLIDSMFGKFGSVAADAQSDPQTAILRTMTGPVASLAVDAAQVGTNAIKAPLALAAGDTEAALTHTGKAVWHASPATVRQLIYMLQSARGTKE